MESIPVLQLVLREASREKSGNPTCTRLPIALSICEHLPHGWNKDPSDHDHNYYALGGMLCGLCRVPQVRRDDGTRIGGI